MRSGFGCKKCWKKNKTRTYLPRGAIRAHLREEHWKKEDAVNRLKYWCVPVSRPAKNAASTTLHASHAAALVRPVTRLEPLSWYTVYFTGGRMRNVEVPRNPRYRSP